MNSLTVFLATFLAFAAMASANENVVMCYFGSWAVYRPGNGKFAIEDIQPHLCTHLIYTFIGLNTDGSIRVLDGWQDLPDNWGKDGFGRFNKLRELSPTTKTLIAIGGWNEGSVKYSQVAADPALRAKFVNNVVEFVQKHGFDGFDVDWEYPNQRGGAAHDKQNFVLLLKELREKFDNHGLLLTAAVGAGESSAALSYDIPQISKYLHYINIMAYDYNGGWSKNTGHNSPLYPSSKETGNQRKLNVDHSIQYWIKEGAPPSKIVLGVPFYGRAFTLANPGSTDLGVPVSGPGARGPYTREAGMLGYNELCEMFKQGGWTIIRDEEQHVPRAIKGNQWVGFDDVESIREKAQYAKKLGLAGAMLWSIETDDFRGICGERYPLLNALNSVLRPGVEVPPSGSNPNPPVTKPPVLPPVTEPVEVPPPTGVCKQEGFVRDPQDCAKFYYCQISGGSFVTIPYSCPKELAFDPVTKACNYRDQVPGC